MNVPHFCTPKCLHCPRLIAIINGEEVLRMKTNGTKATKTTARRPGTGSREAGAVWSPTFGISSA